MTLSPRSLLAAAYTLAVTPVRVLTAAVLVRAGQAFEAAMLDDDE